MSDKIVIHSKTNCPYCVKAKDFFNEKSIPFEEIIYDPNESDYEERKNQLVAKTDFRTFPQIFIGPEFLGGFSDLTDAYSKLKLHKMCENIGITVEVDF
jgi:glutaredoxin 3